MFYITNYQTLIKNAPFPPIQPPNQRPQQHVSNHHVSNQPPTSTTLLQHHVSNQPTANTNNTFPTNTFQTASFKHLYYTPRNAPSFRFQPPPSGIWFSAITPLPTVILLQLVLSHYTLTAGHPPSTGSQPLHPYRRSSSFNWCSEPVKEFIATKAFSYVPKYLMKQS